MSEYLAPPVEGGITVAFSNSLLMRGYFQLLNLIKVTISPLCYSIVASYQIEMLLHYVASLLVLHHGISIRYSAIVPHIKYLSSDKPITPF